LCLSRDLKANAKALAFTMFDIKMSNIIFHYCYRDAANYKNHNAIVFSNPDNIPLSQIKSAIHAALIDEEYFYHEAFGLPPLFFNGHCLEKDPNWHECLTITLTTGQPTESISITEFLTQLSQKK
jgi:hypothetical protein